MHTSVSGETQEKHANSKRRDLSQGTRNLSAVKQQCYYIQMILDMLENHRAYCRKYREQVTFL